MSDGLKARLVWQPLQGWPPSAEVGSACRGTYKPIPDSYSDDLKWLVAALLQKDPRARPAAAAVLAQPYVRRHVQVPAPASAPPVLAGYAAFSASLQCGRTTHCALPGPTVMWPLTLSQQFQFHLMHPSHGVLQAYSAHARQHAQRRRASILRCLVGHLGETETRTVGSSAV
jgi:hypothetical protein